MQPVCPGSDMARPWTKLRPREQFQRVLVRKFLRRLDLDALWDLDRMRLLIALSAKLRDCNEGFSARCP